MADTASKQDSQSSVARPAYGSLLRLTVYGLVIDAQATGGGIVHLTVRANEKQRGLMRRLLQHGANALFRAANACHPSHDNYALRVVAPMVIAQARNDRLAHSADTNVLQVRPIHCANGDAHYNTLLIHEGVENEQSGCLVRFQAKVLEQIRIVLRRQKGADDAHDFPISLKGAFPGAAITILPAEEYLAVAGKKCGGAA